jgi:hypothetical protein
MESRFNQAMSGAAFKGLTVQSDRFHIAGSPSSVELTHWEYQDVYPIGRPDLWMNFASLRELKRGLVELGLKAKGKPAR